MVGLPVIGPLIYRLNVNPFVVHMMVAGHVYSDPNALSAQQKKEKQRVIEAPGVRFGSAAFVTGALDRVDSREAFLDLAHRARPQRILVVYGAETPPKSRAGMEALTTLTTWRRFISPRGKLGIHEEYPAAIEPVIMEFLCT